MVRIAIIGAGTAGCVTALHFYKYLSESIDVNFEIEIYHSPHDHPIEKVGQGTIIQVPLFIQIGEILRIDTKDRKYIERVKS